MLNRFVSLFSRSVSLLLNRLTILRRICWSFQIFIHRY
ncbi:unnamed protein product [Tenebrio molitor]|nr:unnamed protein product [Tenebrio molitor]